MLHLQGVEKKGESTFKPAIFFFTGGRRAERAMSVYLPSRAEVQWYARKGICELARTPFQVRSMRQYLSGNAHYMSRIHNTTIEPLTGIGRHPFSTVGCGFRETGLFDISYLILGSHCARAAPARAGHVALGWASFR